MKGIKQLILATFLLLGLASAAQTIEIPPTLSKGDSVRIITKSGLYNYGIFQLKTDTTLLVFLDNKMSTSVFYINRIAEIFVFPKAKIQTEENTNMLVQTEKKREETFGRNVYNRGSSISALRVGDEIEIRARNGNYYKGKVERNMVMRIDLRTPDNKLIPIPKEDIVYLYNTRDFKESVEDETKMKENVESFSRYFFAPSAIKNKQGTFTYDNSYGFVNSLTYSPTNFLSVTGGAEFISTLMGTPIVMLSPHVGFKVAEQLYIGGGYVYGAMVNVNSTTVNAFYGTATLGNQNKNVTVNIGRGINEQNSITLNVSGYLKVSRNFGLISENWIFENNEVIGDDFPLIGIGGRLYGAKINFDFALINLVVPYLGFSYRF